MEINTIFGPPGTGKTFRLIEILEKEFKIVDDPSKIAIVSFTKKGAYEIRDRALSKFGLKEDDLPYCRTLHSIAFKELGLRREQVIDRIDFKELGTILGMNFLGYYTEDLKHNDDQYLFFDSLVRNNPKKAFTFSNHLDTVKLKLVLSNYKKYKEVKKIVDYTDMIETFVNNNTALPVKVAIVDEAQDLTTIQWKMVFTAFKNCERIYLAGDDDQSIYEWSGADVEYFLKMRGTNFTILDKSYRLPNNIIPYCNRIASNIKNRVSKNFSGSGKIGSIKKINLIEELKIDNQQSWLLLSRNNYFLYSYKNYLEGKGIIFYYKGELSVTKSELTAIHNYTNLKKNENKTVPASLQIHLKNNFDFNQEWYDAFKWTDEKKSYYRNIIKNKNYDIENISSNIRIETIHSIKGGEADNVVLMEDITNNVKKNLNTNPDSEHRVFYTGATRTKENLYILQSKTKNFYNLKEL